jgi:tetratricopeptide (TPR) repeat protein
VIRKPIILWPYLTYLLSIDPDFQFLPTPYDAASLELLKDTLKSMFHPDKLNDKTYLSFVILFAIIQKLQDLYQPFGYLETQEYITTAKEMLNDIVTNIWQDAIETKNNSVLSALLKNTLHGNIIYGIIMKWLQYTGVSSSKASIINLLDVEKKVPLEIDNIKAMTNVAYADILQKEEKFKEAIDLLDGVLYNDAYYGNVLSYIYMHLAYIYGPLNDYEHGIEYYTLAIDNYEPNISEPKIPFYALHFNRAIEYFQTRQYQSALNDIDVYIENTLNGEEDEDAIQLRDKILAKIGTYGSVPPLSSSG